MKTFETIEIPDGCLIHTDGCHYIFDGKEGSPTYMSGWLKIDTIPTKIVNKYVETINIGWVLKYDVGSYPNLLTDDQAGYYTSDYEWIWNKPEYADLYTRRKQQLEIEQDITFKLVSLGKIEHFIDSGTIRIPEKEISVKSLQHNLVDRIFVPEPLLLNDRPCSLSPANLYNIIRNHLRKHLDFSMVVLNDWDNSLTVDKNILLNEPESCAPVYFGKRKKPPVTYRTTRAVRVYNISCDPQDSKYEQTEILEPMVGENPKDLETKLSAFLENLVKWLNEPLKDCPHCKGKGVITNDHK